MTRLEISTPALLTTMSKAAELGDRAGDGPFPARVVGHVQRKERRLGAGLLDRVRGRLAEFFPDVADDDGGSGPGQRLGHARAQLADAALQTLAELGYARTSLREIAQNTQFSHGVLHYYFSDKEDLITHCVRQYEAACVTRYDEIVASAGSATELKREFSAAMAQTLRTDAPMHRLWYDLRNQSLFSESFRADVLEIDQRREEMIWRVISRYAEFAGITVALSPGAAYAVLDGLFQRALLHLLAGQDTAAEDLRANVVRVLDTLEVRD